MDVEYAAFIQRETWTLVPRPIDANVVSCKWVYSLKYNPDGSIALIPCSISHGKERRKISKTIGKFDLTRTCRIYREERGERREERGERREERGERREERGERREEREWALRPNRL